MIDNRQLMIDDKCTCTLILSIENCRFLQQLYVVFCIPMSSFPATKDKKIWFIKKRPKKVWLFIVDLLSVLSNWWNSQEKRTKMFYLGQWNGIHGNQKVPHVPIYHRKRAIYIPTIEYIHQRLNKKVPHSIFGSIFHKFAFWYPLVAETSTRNPPRS